MNSWAATLLCVAAVCALILFLIPPLHPFAWLIGVGLIAVIAVCTLGLASSWVSTQNRLDRLSAELTTSYETARPVTLTEPDEPANPDAELASTIRTLFPHDSGLIQELRINHAGTLTPKVRETLTQFLTDCEHASLINRDAHFAFMDLYRAGQELNTWIDANMVPDSTEPTTDQLVIKPGDQREGGWHAFSRAQSTGENAAATFVTTRATFERVVLENSIVT